MKVLREPSAGLAVAATTAVGAAVGSLFNPIGALIGGAAGLLWGLGLVAGAGWVRGASRRHRIVSAATLSIMTVFAGILTGAGFVSQLMHTAALSSQPSLYAELIRGEVGDAQALPFFLFNTPMEWLLVPAALLLIWDNPRCRKLALALVLLWTFHRVWTYTYFVPRITDWSEAITPMTANQLDQARTWVRLSWVRNAVDIIVTVLALSALVALPVNVANRRPSQHLTG